MNTPRLSIETLIRLRHSLHMEQLRILNRCENAGEENAGIVPIYHEIVDSVARILELEHLADALGVELDRRLYG